jgi:hypothetical protein
MASTRICSIVIVALSLSISSSSRGGDITSARGTKALYTLAQIERRTIDYERIVTRLNALGRSVCTLQDLRDVARDSGLDLVGVRFERWVRQPEGPALVHLLRGPHGHFVTVRPVGHTGKLIQVIDGDLAPEVVDAKEWAASSEWTGFALVPARTPWSLYIAWVLAIVAASVLAIGYVSHRWRKGSRSQPQLSTSCP